MLAGCGCSRALGGFYGLGQVYGNGSHQLPYSDILLQGWSDANGNLSSTWQGYYLATYAYGSLPPMLQGSKVLATTPNQVTFVISDALVQAALSGNAPATPAVNYIPNQPSSQPTVTTDSSTGLPALTSPGSTSSPTPTTSTVYAPVSQSTLQQVATAQQQQSTPASSDLVLGGVDVTQLWSQYWMWIVGAGAALLVLGSSGKR